MISSFDDCYCKWKFLVFLFFLLFKRHHYFLGWYKILTTKAFGLFAADSSFQPSEILQQANVGVLDNPTCQDRLPPAFNGWMIVILQGFVTQNATHICNDNTVAQVCSVGWTIIPYFNCAMTRIMSLKIIGKCVLIIDEQRKATNMKKYLCH